jgi:hypothetical protein
MLDSAKHLLDEAPNLDQAAANQFHHKFPEDVEHELENIEDQGSPPRVVSG